MTDAAVTVATLLEGAGIAASAGVIMPYQLTIVSMPAREAQMAESGGAVNISEAEGGSAPAGLRLACFGPGLDAVFGAARFFFCPLAGANGAGEAEGGGASRVKSASIADEATVVANAGTGANGGVG